MYYTLLRDKKLIFCVRRCVKKFDILPQAYFEKKWKTNCILHYNPTMVYPHTKFQIFWKKSGELCPSTYEGNSILSDNAS